MDNKTDQLDFYNPPTALTLFCDDIRTEADNRYSYIGVYSGKPFSLSSITEKPSKINIVSFLTSPEKEDTLLFIDVHLVYNNKRFGEIRIDHDEVQALHEEEDTINNDETYTYRLAIRVNPFTIVTPSTLELKFFVGYARRGVYELSAGKLELID